MQPHGTSETDSRYPFALAYCGNCGFVQVEQPIPAEILYRNLEFNFSSWKHEPHLADEITALKQLADLSGVVDIGCNDGKLLAELETTFGCQTLGIEPDPVYANIAQKLGIEVINAEANDAIACEVMKRLNVTTVVCRQVLEHVADVNGLFLFANKILSIGGHFLLDVPNFEVALNVGDATVLWEEHIGYFTAPLINALLLHHGFTVEWEQNFEVSHGILALLARKTSGSPKTKMDGGLIASIDIDSFLIRFDEYRFQLLERLETARENERKIIIYGAGVRGATGVNRLGLADLIDFVVDDNAERQGMRLSGTNVEISSIERLREKVGNKPPVFLLAVNNENENVVANRIRSVLGGSPVSIVSICGPRNMLRELANI